MSNQAELDEVFADHLLETGMASEEQLEEGRRAQADALANGQELAFTDALIQVGVITPAIKRNVLKKLQADLGGGPGVLGQYRLIEEIGKGAMGTVYLAEDTGLMRQVAVKVLGENRTSDPGFLNRFRREARAAGNLNHPNVVSAYAVGEDVGKHYYVMEYLEGEALDKILKRGEYLPWDDAVRVATDVAEGLRYAHQNGFLHRDIKPGNIFLCNDGEAKILDLGLSKDLTIGKETSATTKANAMVGTPHYMSPEQASAAKDIDGRTDIYSLGASLFHLVTADTPFDAPNAATLLMKHISEEPRNPCEINPELPDGLGRVMLRMLRKDPDDRYLDCDELLLDLKQVAEGSEPRGAPPPLARAGRGGSGKAIKRARGVRRTTGARDLVRPRDQKKDREGDRDRRRLAPLPESKPLVPALIAGVALALGMGLWVMSRDGDAQPRPRRKPPAEEEVTTDKEKQPAKGKKAASAKKGVGKKPAPWDRVPPNARHSGPVESKGYRILHRISFERGNADGVKSDGSEGEVGTYHGCSAFLVTGGRARILRRMTFEADGVRIRFRYYAHDCSGVEVMFFGTDRLAGKVSGFKQGQWVWGMVSAQEVGYTGTVQHFEIGAESPGPDAYLVFDELIWERDVNVKVE